MASFSASEFGVRARSPENGVRPLFSAPLLLAPLRHLGALGFTLFWLLAASGIYLYIRFDTSVEGAYESIGELEWWFGGVLRSMHRYAADAFVIVVAAHLLRELLAGRFRGFRAFSWISGIPLVWLMYASGVVGYWLVWDVRSQFSFLATLEWIGIGVAAAEAPSNRLFSLFVFLHIGLPLALLAGMWVHVQRLGRPATVAPRALGLGMIAALAALALAYPAVSEAPWNPALAPQALALDWFLLFPHPLMYATSPGVLWTSVLGLTLSLVALPYLNKPKIRPARVDLANCNGCGRCVADCPYEAVRVKNGKAAVFEERCAACGICAGACPSSTPFRSVRELVSGIDLPGFTVHDLRARLQSLLSSNATEVVFRCNAPKKPSMEDANHIVLRCLAMLPPSFIEYALRNGARSVRAIGCREGECAWRIGMDLAGERFAGSREPRLRRTVRATRDDHEYRFSYR